MKYALISDIHSNLEGVSSVLEAIERERPDSIICCGDIVGYAADPSACAELVQRRGIRCIKGNHERGLADIAAGRIPRMNQMALDAIHYSYEQLSSAQREWLMALPDEMEVDGRFLVFHGSPSDPDGYIFDSFEARYGFKSLLYAYPEPLNRLCFIGHTHICAVHAFDPEPERLMNGEVYKDFKVTLDDRLHVMINVGSCGQYRGGIPKASYCIYDTEAETVEFRFVDYDIARAQEKILDAGLPPFLAERLSLGR